MGKKKINILYAIDNLLIGGARELVKTLSLNLDRDLFHVPICSLLDCPEKGDSEPLTDEIVGGAVDVIILHMRKC